MVIRALEAFEYGIDAPAGDPWQMPGTFLIHKGRILKALINECVSDKPDYEGMVCSLNN